MRSRRRAHCDLGQSSVISSASPLWLDLSKVYQKHLVSYATGLKNRLPSRYEGVKCLSPDEEAVVCGIIATAQHCHGQSRQLHDVGRVSIQHH